MIDKAALLAHIKGKASHPNLLIHAVLMGLATAIERGDFDKEGGSEDGPHMVQSGHIARVARQDHRTH